MCFNDENKIFSSKKTEYLFSGFSILFYVKKSKVIFFSMSSVAVSL